MMMQIIEKYILLSLLFLSLTLAYAKAKPENRGTHTIKVTGCSLLKAPTRYTGKMVSVSGVFTVGFERDDLTFDCPGRINVLLALYDTDKKKYGFLTNSETQKKLNEHFSEAHPGDNLLTRKNKTAAVKVTGLFRCHYDFPDCKNVSRDGDSSIIIKSILFVEVKNGSDKVK